LAFWAITVGTSIASYAPLVGHEIRFLLLGDATVGQEALLRFYVLHFVVLPLALSLLVAIHFWRISQGWWTSKAGTCRTTSAQGNRAGGDRGGGSGSKHVDCRAGAPLHDPGTGARAAGEGGKLEEDTVFSWPTLLIAELFVFLLTVAGIMAVSFFFNAPLEQPVNVMHPPNPAKAPWHFLGLQEQVSYSAFWGGVGVPAIELLLLILAPYIDRSREGMGQWFARQRLWASVLFLTFAVINVVLIVIGTFFRGANWQFVSPF
jgi:quinol-cytochrome oxidoreductase complex cytochrome b subunit